MKISIKREFGFIEYDVDMQDVTLLEILDHIKSELDSSLAYSSGCRSSICGSCGVRVNEKEILACSYKIEEGEKIEPLKNVSVIRDLVVNLDKAYKTNAGAKAWISEHNSEVKLTHEDEKINETQSGCILCALCYSACPVYAVNEEFLGPFALTRVWKVVGDKRETESKEKINIIQTNGVWDCTLCDGCTVVCPQGISSKADIEKLQAKSLQYGYINPNFGSFGGGFNGGFDGSPL